MVESLIPVFKLQMGDALSTRWLANPQGKEEKSIPSLTPPPTSCLPGPPTEIIVFAGVCGEDNHLLGVNGGP